MSDAGGDGPAAGFASEAAAMLDRLGGQLVEGGVDGTLSEVRRFARNRPGMFLAAAAGAGFLAGRLVRNVDTGRLMQSDDEVSTGSTAGLSTGSDVVTGPSTTTGGLPGAVGAVPGTTGLTPGPSTPEPVTELPGTGIG